MTGDVGEIEVFGADELDWWAFEHGVVLFANESCVLDGFLKNVVDILKDDGEYSGYSEVGK